MTQRPIDGNDADVVFVVTDGKVVPLAELLDGDAVTIGDVVRVVLDLDRGGISVLESWPDAGAVVAKPMAATTSAAPLPSSLDPAR